MRPFLLAAALLVCGSASAQAYRDYVGQLAAGDTDIDYLAFRLAYAESDAYNPYDTDAGRRRNRMLEAFFGDDDPARAAAIADSVLVLNQTDIDARFISMMAARAQGDSTQGDFHEAVGAGLVSSIVDQADGMSRTSPWRVISVDEEYALMRVFGLRSESQAMDECAGERCDHLTVLDPETNETSDLYFDVSIPWGYLQKESRR